MIIAIGNDHVGLDLVKELSEYFKSKNMRFDHFGTFDSIRMNYPEIAFEIGGLVSKGHYDCGILFCGTGLGMSLAANKIKGIRAVACNTSYLAKMARAHNDANILCLGSRVLNPEAAKNILDIWFKTDFEKGRHQTRVDMINNC